MKNHLACLEGKVSFNEDVNVQNLDFIKFRTGQQISVSRDRLPEGNTFHDHISQKLSNAHKVFNRFNLVKMEKFAEQTPFTDVIHIIYNFSSGPAAEQRAWQVTYACLFANDKIMNFTSVYSDEEAMKNESNRLYHCVTNFIMNKN